MAFAMEKHDLNFFFLSHFSSSVEKKMDKEEAGDKKVIAVLGER